MDAKMVVGVASEFPHYVSDCGELRVRPELKLLCVEEARARDYIRRQYPDDRDDPLVVPV